MNMSLTEKERQKEKHRRQNEYENTFNVTDNW